MDKRYSAGHIAKQKADIAEHKRKCASKKPLVCRSKVHGENSPGFCLLCGEGFGFITTAHLAKHGFKTRREMIASGAVRFTDFFDGR